MRWFGRIQAAVRNPAAVFFGAAVLARLGAFALVPLYTRKLTLDEYGQYALFLTVVALGSTFLSCGTGAAITRAYFSDSDQIAGRARAIDVARWMVIVTGIMTGVVFIAVALCADPSDTSVLGRGALLKAVVAGAGMALAPVPWLMLRAAQRSYAAAAFQLVQFVSTTAGGLVLVGLLDRGIEGAMEGACVGNGIAGLAALAFIGRQPWRPLRASTLRSSLRFGAPFVPHFMAAWAQSAADRWVLETNGFSTALGEYSLATQVASPVPMLTTAYNDVETARMGEIFRAQGLAAVRDARSGLRRRFVLVNGALAITLIVSLPLVSLAIGNDFLGALVLVPVVLLTMLPDPVLYSVEFHTVYFAGRTRLLGAATVAAALLNVVMNVLLVPWFGVWGALAARFAAGATRVVALSWAAARG